MSDLISREALKKELNFVYSCAYIESKSKEGIASDIVDVIDSAPTVEPYSTYIISGKRFGKREEALKWLRPQGEWIYNDKLNMYYCKDCGLLEPFTKEEIEEGVKLPNFCEQCGADMRKEADNDD